MGAEYMGVVTWPHHIYIFQKKKLKYHKLFIFFQVLLAINT